MIKGKRIAVFGFAKEGLSAANYLGAENFISIIDEKTKDELDKSIFRKLKNKADFYLGRQLPKNLEVDIVIRSPGVRPDNLQIQQLIKNGATLTSATKIFFDQCPATIIGVTGTKGKGTTSTLIYEMLKTRSDNVFLAGNIGTPALDILGQVNQKSIVVLELSSFQLFDLHKSPHIAVVLMITQEHLDWHTDVNEYVSAKESIVANQSSSDFAIINQDFESSKSYANKTPAHVYFTSTKGESNGVYVSGGFIKSKIAGSEKICEISEILLPGTHNLQNICASAATAKILKVDNKNIAKILKTFKGLIHRLQLVREIAGVKYYNDSYATTPETTIAAIEAFTSPKILIFGGSSKNSNFTELGKKISSDKTIKSIVLIGVESARIEEAIDKAGGFGGRIKREAINMQDIVALAKSEAAGGDVVLFSPACASFDMFKNYQDRGEQFIKYVKLQK
ncbi:MAG: UDP-N-acetylmuramoyl-L-alanine--D-glutamate ligase [Candidatus Curtissbacteria bacterium]|nr:UDP-N-acetylmuramoyl-L-alanine--D-glutamate ligase [Candidatus Curtissbacteria bacterium]